MSALLAALLLSAPADLRPALVFDAPATCGLGAPLRSIVGQLQPGEEGTTRPPVPVPGFAEPLRPSVIHFRQAASGGGMTLVALILVGRWHGLRVVRLEHWFEVGTPRTSVRIQFEERADRTRTALNAAGFDLGPVGGLRPFQGGGHAGRIGIHAVGSQSSLICDFE